MNTLTAPKAPTESIDWHLYCRNTRNKPPSDLARSSLALSKRTRPCPHVLELGPGSCADARFFLENGADTVTAVDASTAVRPYASALANEFLGRFMLQPVLFRDFGFDDGPYDLIFAQHSLQYHGTEGFDSLVGRIIGSLAPGGVFAATFIGTDHFVKKFWSDLAFSSRVDVERRLASLRIVDVREQREMKYAHECQGLVNHFIVMATRP
ncbi:MAG TPA: class I SAM-dependent methyltransferase [Candidatus Paceibacterota bacterium]|nr:class I SAM-dependent methyltransferase [Candidatus Paceibacterota bacterium]